MAVRHLLLCAGEASFLLRFPRHEMWKGDSSCFFLFATVDANKKPPESQGFKWFSLDGAAIQIRTGDLILTKDALYQLSYSSKWRPGSGSNRRPPAWQAGALTNWATGPWSLKCVWRLTAGTCVIIPEKHPVVKREIQKNPKKFQKVRHLGEKGKNKTHRVSSVRLWQG